MIVMMVVGARLVTKQDWLGSALLVAGWVIGYLLAEVDQIFYVAMCNPQELSCQRVRHEIWENKNWKLGWQLLQETAGERTRLPVHNVLTGLLVAGVGVWAAGSGVNLLGVGVGVGLSLRLFSELAVDPGWPKWYWLFAREFSLQEHRVVMGVWGLLLVMALVGLAR